MKNEAKWQQTRFTVGKNGKIVGPHMQRIIVPVYKQAIEMFCKGKMVDLGCGNVPYYTFYKEVASEITCVDWGNSLHNLSYCDFETDLNADLPFESESFDTIVATDLIEHLYNPERFMSEASRILKSGGHAIIGVPFMYWIHENHDYHRYTKQKLEHFCTSNKLEVVLLEAYGGYPEVLYDILHKGYAFYGFRGRRVYYFFLQGFGRFLSKRKFVKKLSAKSRDTFPLGYILVAKKHE